MTEDDMRDLLMDVLSREMPASRVWGVADDLLQTVRRIVAEELRAAAAEAHDEYSGWEAANMVRARAAALDGTT